MNTIDFYIVQHGEKEQGSGDPPLTALGVVQSRATGAFLVDKGISRVISSQLRRATETAWHLAEPLDLEVGIDERLRERMNWVGSQGGQTVEDFLAEWNRATRDRDFVPTTGDSSRVAGKRFEAMLEELSESHHGASIAIVSHGGVTIDLLRTLFGDAVLRARYPGLVASGVPGCAITQIQMHQGAHDLISLASVAHLDATVRSGHRAE